MYREVLGEAGGVRIAAMDSIAQVAPEDRGHVVVCGSHAGASAGEYALKAGLRAAIFNDAGVGKEEAGIRALAMLDAAGIPAAAVSHLSARIGDGRDVWESGLLSHVNESARALGLVAGMRVRDAAWLLLPSSPPPPPEVPAR